MPKISPTATVDPNARLAEDVEIGPYCQIGPDVSIGEGTVLMSHVIITGKTTIGCGNRFYPYCIIGMDPQFKKPDPSPGKLVIGDENIFRESVVVHVGSSVGVGTTRIGSRGFFMHAGHIGHDAQVEDDVVISTAAYIVGHVKVEHHAWLNGLSGAHQYVTFGRYSYIGALTGAQRDVPPYVVVTHHYPEQYRGINVEGLRRNNFSEQQIRALQEAFRRLYGRRGNSSFADALAELDAQKDLDQHVRYFVDFIKRSTQHPHGRQREPLRHRTTATTEPEQR